MTGVSEKWREKMFSTSRKITCPLARMSSFSQNCFPLIPIMVSTSSEALTKAYCVGSSFSISWNYILDESFITARFSVYWKRYSFIQIFLEISTAIRGRPIFKKNIVSMEVLFPARGNGFFIELFIPASRNRFSA